jgi:ATP phosphoribosyltransferase regulatory subunit
MSVWQPSWQPPWQLPDHLADVLPSEARHIEELRRDMLDTARSYGYALVMPPLLEHIESLLTGTGEALDLQTFKLVDQLSGRMLGLRADTTPQVARIDAHLLNRSALTRLCYCGPVLHTRPDRPHATREPLQFGAEIYGHAGQEADLEALLLALDCLQAAGIHSVTVDMADVRIVDALLVGATVDAQTLSHIHAALAAKDASTLQALSQDFPTASREGLMELIGLYGDSAVLDKAAQCLPATPAIQQALSSLRTLADQLQGRAGVTVSFDLADLRGYAYYSGPRFGIYVPGASDALVRGGRYDGVGAAFDHGASGVTRPAVGFSLDLKALASVAPVRSHQAAIRAPWAAHEGAEGGAEALRSTIAALRRQGETVVCSLPGHDSGAEADLFPCDRVLTFIGGQWVVTALEAA